MTGEKIKINKRERDDLSKEKQNNLRATKSTAGRI